MFLKRESVLDVSQYAFGNQPGLKWFLQPDVKDFLSGPLRLFSGELICVHDEFQSHLQHSFVRSELVTKATANAELKYAPMPTFTPKVRSLYPERFAQEALGHNSKAVHRAYAKRALMKIPSLEEYEKRACATLDKLEA